MLRKQKLSQEAHSRNVTIPRELEFRRLLSLEEAEQVQGSDLSDSQLLLQLVPGREASRWDASAKAQAAAACDLKTSLQHLARTANRIPARHSWVGWRQHWPNSAAISLSRHCLLPTGSQGSSAGSAPAGTTRQPRCLSMLGPEWARLRHLGKATRKEPVWALTLAKPHRTEIKENLNSRSQFKFICK